MKVLGLITARGGSKGLPGKHLRLLGGKPLIVWTIEAALRAPELGRVMVSTDDPQIAAVCREHGADVPFLRPAELASDTSPHILTSEHALRWVEQEEGALPDYCLLLQPTSPLRTTADIRESIALAGERRPVAVVGVTPAAHHPAHLFNLDSGSVLTPCLPADTSYKRRQDLPPVLAVNGAIYLNRTTDLLRDRTYTPPGALAHVMPRERSVDVDTEWDLAIAEMWLARQSRTEFST